MQTSLLKYLGLTLLLTWHYCLWFVPQVLFHTPLLADTVTWAWLVDLGASALTLFALPLVLGRKRHLQQIRALEWIAPLVMSAGTAYFSLVVGAFDIPVLASIIAGLLGVASAVMWILWGEHYTCMQANFSIRHVAPVFGFVLLVSLGLTVLLPPYAGGVFTALLPLVSGGLFIRMRQTGNCKSFPLLLPKTSSQRGLRSIIPVCLIALVTSISSYFLIAIIPSGDLPLQNQGFTLGIFGGALVMLMIALVSTLLPNRYNIFRLFPWLLVLLTMALALFLVEFTFNAAVFIIALSISSVLEVLLAIYFGLLTVRGYVAPALAFGLSGGFIRLGILIGNSLALFYGGHDTVAIALSRETTFVFICLLAALLITLVRQEYNIVALTSAPPKPSELNEVCCETAREFGLSEREAEILRLVAHGYTSATVAEKLLISPYTVNTHIQHIYEKMQIHKRSDLLNYLNMQRGDL
jgi:DNA-binding CsgD family transcriptional regulator